MIPATLSNLIRNVADAPTVPCPCGFSTRIVTALDGLGASFHITEIRDSVKHYHAHTNEIYYILEGSGLIELDRETYCIQAGQVITIPAGVRHRLKADEVVKTIVIAIPAFDPTDEHFDDN
jgi:mannose-6-phosphate isomerase-like protein (cupin superfamily)